MTRVGVLGGTFDPPHVGHVALGAEARFSLGLDQVLFVVANDPWQKTAVGAVTPAETRLALTRAALEGTEGLVASDLEIRRGGPSYTIDTVEDLRAQVPGAEVHLIVGADVAAALDTWHRAADLREAVVVVVIDRPGVPAGDPPPGWRHVRLGMPRLEVASRDLRARVAEGRPIDGLVPAAACTLIRRLGLYREARL